MKSECSREEYQYPSCLSPLSKLVGAPDDASAVQPLAPRNRRGRASDPEDRLGPGPHLADLARANFRRGEAAGAQEAPEWEGMGYS